MGSSKVFTFLVPVTVGLSILGCFVLTEEYDRILIFKEPVLNKALKGHVIRTVKVTDEGSCRVRCYMEPNCVSVNVGPQVDGSHVCELNNSTDESSSLSDLRKKNGYTYYGIENPCHSNPCSGKSDICQVGFTDKGFRCVCRKEYKKHHCDKDIDVCVNLPCLHGGTCTDYGDRFKCDCAPGFTGTKCEIACPSGWKAFQGSCYALFNNDLNWWAAKESCINNGAQLVKIESSGETNFIKTQFLSETVDYWIGLTDAETEGIWKWSDGSIVSGYKNWGANQPNNKNGNQNCGGIRMRRHHNHHFDAEWHDKQCRLTKGYICEIYI